MLEILKKNNQYKILEHLKTLKNEDKQKLLKNLEKINFLEFNENINLIKNIKIKEKLLDINKIRPIEPMNKKINYSEKHYYFKKGIEIFKNGEYAVLIMSAGQGSRLGFNAPKGMLTINLGKIKKSIFEIHFDDIKKKSNEYSRKFHIFITTSDDNDLQIKDFFKEKNYFSYDKNYIHFIKQDMIISCDSDFNIILKDKTNVFFSPNGNGDIAEILRKNKVFELFKNENIKWLQICNIDNILTKHFDENFIGIIVKNNYNAGAKVVKKICSDEKIGLLVDYNENIKAIEYTEMPQFLLNLRDDFDNLIFSNGNIANYIFNIEILENINKNDLHYHIAKKNISCYENGKIIVKENCYKFEKFILDIFEYFDKMLIYEVNKDDEFAPIKNKIGVDSIETAIKLYKKHFFS